MNVEIFVLNYNGRDLLLECLPSIVDAAKKSSYPCLVTVIDNNSHDDSLELLKNNFPDVRVLALQTNFVLCAFNDAVKNSSADVVLLLNNDLKLEADCVDPLIAVMQKHEDAFLVGPKCFTFDKTQYEGSLSKWSMSFGLLKSESRFEGYSKLIDQPGYTMQAGFGAYRKKYFVELGGFDSLYLPGTVEDCDICFRAWKAGYACYYEPQSRMLHKGQATFKRNFSRFRILAINQRNLYLFTWKNMLGGELFLTHILFLLIRPLLFLIRGKFESITGLFLALGRISSVIRSRKTSALKTVRSDKEIFLISKSIQ